MREEPPVPGSEPATSRSQGTPPRTRPGILAACRAVLAGLALLAASTAQAAIAPDQPNLRRGVNLSQWMQYEARQPVVARDMQMIRAAGFDHVRLPFDPARLKWNPAAPAADHSLPGIETLDKAVNLAVEHGLTAIVDFHPGETLRERIETDPATQAEYVRLWRWLAGHYRNFPTGRIVFEPLNEPQFYNFTGQGDWEGLIRRVIQAIRTAAPAHTLIVSGALGGDIKGLSKLTPVNDPRVIYSFHFYEPMLLTHLNATWPPFAKGKEGMLRGIRYPSYLTRLAEIAILPGARPAEAMEIARDYMESDWDGAAIKARIDEAAKWARRHNVRIVCNEFGILRLSLDGVSRNRWLKDVRTALDQAGAGWTIWEYADVFGIASPEAGKGIKLAVGANIPADPAAPVRVFDRDALAALGMGSR